jgi:hypothetical protein
MVRWPSAVSWWSLPDCLLVGSLVDLSKRSRIPAKDALHASSSANLRPEDLDPSESSAIPRIKAEEC